MQQHIGITVAGKVKIEFDLNSADPQRTARLEAMSVVSNSNSILHTRIVRLSPVWS